MAYGITQSAGLVGASSQYFTAADSTSLSITGNMTVEAWIKLSTLPVNGGAAFAIVSKGNLSGLLGGWGYFGLYQSGGQVFFRLNLSSGIAASNSDVSWSPSTATWYHVAVAYDTGGNVKFYVNGVQQGATQTGAVTSLYDDTTAGAIGAYTTGSYTAFFNGRISLARIWNTNLSAATILANICTVYGSAQTNMAAEWSLNNVLTDASGNTNTLTNVNTATFAVDTPATCAVVGSGFFMAATQ